MKRLVVATFASAVVIVPISAPAQADASSDQKVVKTVKAKPGGGYTVQRSIDWE